jgi:hypothetical protein
MMRSVFSALIRLLGLLVLFCLSVHGIPSYSHEVAVCLIEPGRHVFSHIGCLAVLPPQFQPARLVEEFRHAAAN